MIERGYLKNFDKQNERPVFQEQKIDPVGWNTIPQG